MFLCFGELRAYKDIEVLLAAFASTLLPTRGSSSPVIRRYRVSAPPFAQLQRRIRASWACSDSSPTTESRSSSAHAMPPCTLVGILGHRGRSSSRSPWGFQSSQQTDRRSGSSRETAARCGCSALTTRRPSGLRLRGLRAIRPRRRGVVDAHSESPRNSTGTAMRRNSLVSWIGSAASRRAEVPKGVRSTGSATSRRLARAKEPSCFRRPGARIGRQ